MLSARGDPSIKCLGDVVGVGDEQPIVVFGADVNVDVDGDLVAEVRCPPLHEVSLPGAPGVVQGSKVRRTHVCVRVMVPAW